MAASTSSLSSDDQANPALTVKYWGVTGSFNDPWRPKNTLDWLARVMTSLRESGLLKSIADGSLNSASVAILIEKNLDPALLAGPRRQTTCIEIRTPAALFLVDAGSGLRDFELSATDPNWQAVPAENHLLFTHGHWDHLLGLPFYSGFFDVEPRFTVWASERVLALLRMMFDHDSVIGETLIPTNFEHLRALRELRTIAAGETRELADVRITTMALNHPAGSLAYRFEHCGRSLVIATDHEQDYAPSPDSLIEFARGADLLYLDAQYTQAEYLGQAGIAGEPPQSRRGWGHSALETAVTVGIAAGVKNLHLGHHDPRRSDSELERLEQQAQALGAKLLKAQNRQPNECQIAMAQAGQSLLL